MVPGKVTSRTPVSSDVYDTQPLVMIETDDR